MQVSLKWVNELVNVETVNLEYLIEKLTLGGFEVEEILEVDINKKKTITLEISATANRSDSLSIQGISSEIACLLNKPFKSSNYLTKNFTWKQKVERFSESKLSTTDCSAFLTLVVENLINLTSPEWLKQKLMASGLSVENNLQDFQNYILVETGYPFEFYDLDKIYSKANTNEFCLNLTTSKDKETFVTTDRKHYQLNESILIVKANKLPLSIAGIAPSKDTYHSTTTTSLLIEGSIFNSRKVRQQSRSLGLRTERSAKYEKSLKSTNLLKSCYRLVSLLRILNPNLRCKLHTFYHNVQLDLITISLHYENINKILGPIQKSKNGNYKYLSVKIITDYLKRLNFDSNYDKTNLIWKVKIPDSRTEDVVREIDLIEEIGRLHGFNNFLIELPKIKTIGNEDLSYQTRKKVTSCLINLGFNELIHYSLVNEKTYLNNETKLINPLLKDCSYLRLSLLPNLIKMVQENWKKANTSIEGFEYGHVFSGSSPQMFQEKEHIAGIFGGIKAKLSWSDSSTSLSWFEAKGKIEQFFEKLNILTYWKGYKAKNDKNIFHPYCSSEVFLSCGTKLGVFGQVHPILAKKLNISTDLYFFEFDFLLIQNQIQRNKLSLYQEYSTYPKIVKDLSFIINNNICFNELQEILYLNGSKFLTEINLLDEYKGHSISENDTSLCLQLIFQSKEKTLQNKQVENILNNLQLLLAKKFQAKIRI